MSPRRWFGGALLLAALALTAWAIPARAQIVARVGGNLAGRVGDTLNVPITVDMTGAPGVRLGGYRMTIRYNPNVLINDGGSPGTFAEPLVREDSAGVLRLTAIQPSGADGIITLAVGHFVVYSDTGASDITVTFEEMSGVAPTFDDLLPMLTVVNGTFCHAAGRWGDVDGDGQANSRDALVALSRVVGIALDTTSIYTWTDTGGTHADTTVTLRPGLADVDGDGQVTSRDALIIMSYAVGLPVPGFRIGLAAAAGACGSGFGLTLAITPDTLELQTGQTANVVVSARDSYGNSASLNGATWTSGNTAVAGVTSPGFGITARDPGVATLTAQLGAGYRGSMVVKVIAHRTQWYVDVARLEATLQTGSQRFPFPFIQDAFDFGRDGDTINVARGTYEESVGSDISVYLRGDSVDLPVIDPRGAPYYNSSTPALSTGSLAAPMVIEHLRALHGQVSIYARGLSARDVHVEGDSLISEPFYFESSLGEGSFPSDTGDVVLDNVTVHNYGQYGIDIYLAGTATIRNSAVTRDSTTFPYCYSYGPTGIYINAASHTDISHTTVLSAPCVGIAVDQQGGTVRLSRNTVDRTAGMGIAANGDSIAFDHNVVSRIISGSSEAEAGGLVVRNSAPGQVVTSLGDVIIDSGDRGFILWGVRNATVDSLTVSNVGFDNTNTSAGVQFWGGHLTLSNSHINSVVGNGGAGVLAWTPDTSRTVLESRHNVITYTAAQGLYASSYTPGYGCAPPMRGAPPVARGAMGGCGGNGPDTLISVGDTILYAGGAGISAEHGRRLFVDSAVIDSTGGAGVLGYYMMSTLVRNSVIRMTPNGSGVGISYGDSVTVSGSQIVGAYDGVGAYQIAGAAKVFGTRIDSSGGNGLSIDASGSGAPVVVDSSRIAGSGWAGLEVRCDYSCGDTAFVTRSTITGNNVGLVNGGYLGYAVIAHRNNIFGNTLGGARNEDSSTVIMNADTNYWGDANGPQCSGGVPNCSGLGAGDFILSQGITFVDWLDIPATDVMLAPPNMRPVARRLAPVAVAAARPARAATPRLPVEQRAARPQPQPRPPLMTWRKGQQPRPAKVHHPA